MMSTEINQPKDAIEAMRELQKSLVFTTDEDAKSWIWKNEIVPRLRDAGYADRFHKQITDWKCKPQQRVFEQCMKLCQNKGAVIVLAGVRGAGKTTIAAQMALNRAMDNDLEPWERQPPYRKLSSLVARFKPIYSDFGSTNTESLISGMESFCTSCSLVVIDEIHECQELRVKDRVLVDIVDRRYAAKKDTILISNQDPVEFSQTANPSILSRISEHGTIIGCKWDSWRKTLSS